MAGRQGFEPRYAAPEAAVLPLDDLPMDSFLFYQLGLYDEAVWRGTDVVKGVAGNHRQQLSVAGGSESPAVGTQYADIGWLYDPGGCHLVCEESGLRLEGDAVTEFNVFESTEQGVAMGGDGKVASLTGKGCGRYVTHRFLQRFLANALAHDGGEIQSVHGHATDDTAVRRDRHGCGRATGALLIKGPVLIGLINRLTGPVVTNVSKAEESDHNQNDAQSSKRATGLRFDRSSAAQVMAVDAGFE